MRGYVSGGECVRGATVTLLEARCDKQSKRAIHVEALGLSFWVPLSVVAAASEVWREGDAGKLVLAYWWVKQQGWNGKARGHE